MALPVGLCCTVGSFLLVGKSGGQGTASRDLSVEAARANVLERQVLQLRARSYSPASRFALVLSESQEWLGGFLELGKHRTASCSPTRPPGKPFVTVVGRVEGRVCSPSPLLYYVYFPEITYIYHQRFDWPTTSSTLPTITQYSSRRSTVHTLPPAATERVCRSATRPDVTGDSAMPFGPFVLEIRRGSDGFARCAGPSSISSLDSRYLISDWCGGWQPGRVETLHGACPVIVFVVTASHGWPFGKDPRGAPGCVCAEDGNGRGEGRGLL